MSTNKVAFSLTTHGQHRWLTTKAYSLIVTGKVVKYDHRLSKVTIGADVFKLTTDGHLIK